MKFLCIRSELQKAVAMVEKAVAVRSTLPVIGNILIEAKEKEIILTGYDLEIGITLSLSGTIKETGSLLVPAKTFGNIISKLDEGEVILEQESRGNLKISNKKSIFNIHTLTADEFPKLPEVKSPKRFKIPAKNLLDIVKHTLFSVSTDESKQVLNGIYFHFQKNNLNCVATDGYRLAKKTFTLEEKVADNTQFIMPTKALNEVTKIWQGSDAQLEIAFSKEQLEIKSEGVYLITRLIQGQFPDYNQVIPKKTEATIVVNRKELLAASERSAIIAANSANIIHLELVEGQLHISANTPEVGTCSELINVSVQGKFKDTVAFNVRLLLDSLKIIDEDDVVLEMTGKLSPGIIKPKASLDYLYVVMPIRTTEPVPA